MEAETTVAPFCMTLTRQIQYACQLGEMLVTQLHCRPNNVLEKVSSPDLSPMSFGPLALYLLLFDLIPCSPSTPIPTIPPNQTSTSQSPSLPPFHLQQRKEKSNPFRHPPHHTISPTFSECSKQPMPARDLCTVLPTRADPTHGLQTSVCSRMPDQSLRPKQGRDSFGYVRPTSVSGAV